MKMISRRSFMAVAGAATAAVALTACGGSKSGSTSTAASTSAAASASAAAGDAAAAANDGIQRVDLGVDQSHLRVGSSSCGVPGAGV